MTVQLRHPHPFNSVTGRARRGPVRSGSPCGVVDDSLMESPLAEQLRIVQQRIAFMMAVQGVAGPEALVPFTRNNKTGLNVAYSGPSTH